MSECSIRSSTRPSQVHTGAREQSQQLLRVKGTIRSKAFSSNFGVKIIARIMSALENMQKEELLETHKKLLKALKEAIICPVCLLVPKTSSVPSCPNGHVTCSPCLHLMRSEGRTDCPTCRVNMGDGKSILAQVIVEHVDHECGLDGCFEQVANTFYLTKIRQNNFLLSLQVPFHSLGEHEQLCVHRLVLCPGSNELCNKMVPFCKVWE